MRNILVPVDDSECAMRAVRHAVALAAGDPTLRLHLLTVQEPVPLRLYGGLSAQEIRDMQATDAQRVLAPATELAEQAGIAWQSSWRSGDVAQTIAACADEFSCESIVMGTRGMGKIGSLVMGSVASKVVYLARVPVTLVK